MKIRVSHLWGGPATAIVIFGLWVETPFLAYGSGGATIYMTIINFQLSIELGRARAVNHGGDEGGRK